MKSELSKDEAQAISKLVGEMSGESMEAFRMTDNEADILFRLRDRLMETFDLEIHSATGYSGWQKLHLELESLKQNTL